jgi:hypothetical protein
MRPPGTPISPCMTAGSKGSITCDCRHFVMHHDVLSKLSALTCGRMATLWCICPGGFYIGKISSESNLPGSIVVSLIGYFLACYYFLQVDIGPGGTKCCQVCFVYCALLSFVVVRRGGGCTCGRLRHMLGRSLQCQQLAAACCKLKHWPGCLTPAPCRAFVPAPTAVCVSLSGCVPGDSPCQHQCGSQAVFNRLW